jgi:hypothetical protein
MLIKLQDALLQRRLTLVNFLITREKGPIFVFVVKRSFFLLPQNIIQVVDGQVFFSQLMKHASQNIKIHPME